MDIERGNEPATDALGVVIEEDANDTVEFAGDGLVNRAGRRGHDEVSFDELVVRCAERNRGILVTRNWAGVGREQGGTLRRRAGNVNGGATRR